jgi:Zn-dependent peptidase ImmA (M78 family)
MSDTHLDAVFGTQSRGKTPQERASTSDVTFVRSQHQLSHWTEGAGGRVLNAGEALDLFGWEVLRDLADHPATPIVRRGAEAHRAILKQIHALGVEERKVFDVAKLSRAEVEALKLGRQVPYRKLERLAQSISLEPEKLGIEPDSGADQQLGFRLRTMAHTEKILTPVAVLALAEAAWVIRKQVELSERLGETHSKNRFNPDPDYGSQMVPAYTAGFRLASETRVRLDIKPSEPIESMTQLLESKLGVPVVYVDLPGAFAGATLASGSARGIVVNGLGGPELVWVRRMTMAHELGHFLWDPTERLNRLIVDRRKDVEEDFTRRSDPVEQRANAFAVEFLAPRDALAQIFLGAQDQRSAVETVIKEYGIGRAASIFHLQNRLHGVAVKPGPMTLQPDTALVGREEVSLSIFDPPEVPISRRGRFAILVGRAAKARLISEDTAGAMLGCPPHKTQKALDWIASLEKNPH